MRLELKQKQADVNSLLLLLGLLCHMLPLLFRYASGLNNPFATNTLQLSRISSIFMLIAYVAYIFFQLKTHRQFFESQEVVVILVACLIHNVKNKLSLYELTIKSIIINIHSLNKTKKKVSVGQGVRFPLTIILPCEWC